MDRQLSTSKSYDPGLPPQPHAMQAARTYRPWTANYRLPKAIILDSRHNLMRCKRHEPIDYGPPTIDFQKL